MDCKDLMVGDWIDDGYNVRNEQHLIAKYAVELADAFVAELKKGGQDDSNNDWAKQASA